MLEMNLDNFKGPEYYDKLVNSALSAEGQKQEEYEQLKNALLKKYNMKEIDELYDICLKDGSEDCKFMIEVIEEMYLDMEKLNMLPIDKKGKGKNKNYKNCKILYKIFIAYENKRKFDKLYNYKYTPYCSLLKFDEEDIF